MSVPDMGPAATFREGLLRGTLKLQRCRGCARAFHRPRMICPHCGSCDYRWMDAQGRGVVHSITAVHRPPADFRGEAPYQVAFVDLIEEVRVIARIIGTWVAIGDAVDFVPMSFHGDLPRVAFEKRQESHAER